MSWRGEDEKKKRGEKREKKRREERSGRWEIVNKNTASIRKGKSRPEHVDGSGDGRVSGKNGRHKGTGTVERHIMRSLLAGMTAPLTGQERKTVTV